MWVPLEDVGQGHAPDLVDHVLEERVHQGGGSHVHDLGEEGHLLGQDQG